MLFHCGRCSKSDLLGTFSEVGLFNMFLVLNSFSEIKQLSTRYGDGWLGIHLRDDKGPP